MERGPGRRGGVKGEGRGRQGGRKRVEGKGWRKGRCGVGEGCREGFGSMVEERGEGHRVKGEE